MSLMEADPDKFKMKKIKKKIISVIPPFIMRRIDAAGSGIEEFVIQLSQEIPAGAKVLDAGSGEAQFKKFFGNHKYTAIDMRCGESEWNYRHLDVVGDLSYLPFREGAFDAILCTQVLEHVREPETVLNEFSRVLKDGGVFYLSAPQGWGVHQAPHDYYRYTCYGLRYLLEKTGFKKVEIKQSCGYFGYLGNRLTVLPKVLFWRIRRLWLRIILFPIEMLFDLLFVFIFPLLLNSIDFLDWERDYTLNYFVKAFKLIGKDAD